ncbi:hypothetical protein JCM10450v2_002215 [Rhodotorula kratochvilovae]
MPASSPPSSQPGTTPARPPPSASDSPLSPTQQQCLTPPSVRRREARIARCTVRANARADAARRAAETGGSGDGDVREDEVTAPREGYAADEVNARRAGRRAAAWQGWEAEAARYAGPQLGEGALVRGDGTVDWALFDAGGMEELDAGDVGGWEGPLPLGNAPEPAYQAVLRSLDATGALPPPQPAFQLPALPSSLGPTELPHNTLPLVLGALYVAARAFGLGSRRPAGAASGAGVKVRRWEDERGGRD